MKTQVCAAVVVYNNPDELTRLLSSLKDQGDSLSGLIVVDNSDDRYLAANKRVFHSYSDQYSFSRYLEMRANVGAAGGWRRGMQIAHENGFGWVWLWDSDGAASPLCLNELLKCGEQGDILCPYTVDIDQPDASVLTVYTKNFLGRHIPAEWCSTSCQIHSFGANATLISKKALDTIGYFDDSFFFVGFEDGDYADRALHAGLTIFYVRRAKAQHPNPLLSRKRGPYRALYARRLDKYGEQPLWSREGRAVPNGNELSRIRARELPKLWTKINKLLPCSLGYITDLEGQDTPCSRTRSIAPFSRVYLQSKILRPWQFGIALAYSMCVGLCRKIMGQRGIALTLTLRLYLKCLAHRLKGDWPYTSVEQLCREVMQ
jgi:GT2 family glycosyltransferase